MINFLTSIHNNPIRQNQRSNSPKRAFTLSNYNNLRPLAKDTISFTSNSSGELKTQKDSRTKTLNIDLMHAFDNKEACKEVCENAKFASGYLKKILYNNLYHLIESKNNPKGIIQKIDIRVKSPDSIREKIANVLGNAIVSENPTAFNPNLKEEIKSHCTDIVGARIIMAKGAKGDCGRVTNALIKEIESGKLKVTSIENYVSKDKNSIESYFNDSDLKRLENAVNKQRVQKGLSPIKAQQKEKQSGYMALHLDIDLSSSNFKVKDNGYKGEIQIVGYDVCKFKELEDLLYKIKSDKTIKGGDCAYSPFIKYFKKQMSNPEFKDLDSDFKEYTKRAYIHQKRRNDSANKNYMLPTIKDCNMEGKIPQALDFNVLNRVKQSCDRLYEIAEQYSYNTES